MLCFKSVMKTTLTLGLMMPFDNAEHNALSFSEQGDLAKYAETLGFTSLFVRDSPLYSTIEWTIPNE